MTHEDKSPLEASDPLNSHVVSAFYVALTVSIQALRRLASLQSNVVLLCYSTRTGPGRLNPKGFPNPA